MDEHKQIRANDFVCDREWLFVGDARLVKPRNGDRARWKRVKMNKRHQMVRGSRVENYITAA